jgi:hypothetical protein
MVDQLQWLSKASARRYNFSLAVASVGWRSTTAVHQATAAPICLSSVLLIPTLSFTQSCAYSKRLEGQLGIVDVQDTIEAATCFAEGDPKRLCIRGGSSGGYTVLAALCDAQRADVFAAGTSLYGISDLVAVCPPFFPIITRKFTPLSYAVARGRDTQI